MIKCYLFKYHPKILSKNKVTEKCSKNYLAKYEMPKKQSKRERERERWKDTITENKKDKFNKIILKNEKEKIILLHLFMHPKWSLPSQILSINFKKVLALNRKKERKKIIYSWNESFKLLSLLNLYLI